MNYEQKILKYKQKYLNLKKMNTMKGGAHMEIKLTKDEDGSIQILLPPNFSSADSGTYIFEHKSEPKRELEERKRDTELEQQHAIELKRCQITHERRVRRKINEYNDIFTKFNGHDKINSKNKDLYIIWSNIIARNVFIYLLNLLCKVDEDDTAEDLDNRVMIKIGSINEFMKNPIISPDYKFTTDQIELKKIFDSPVKYGEIITALKTVLNFSSL